MSYFVAPGKSITTKRGVVAFDDENPEITVKDFGISLDNKDGVKDVGKTLETLVNTAS